MKRGFTLVELLAVVVIISLLTVLTVTIVGTIVKNGKNELNDKQITLIKKAAQIWGTENIGLLPNSEECYYITLGDLKNSGYLNDEVYDINNTTLLSDELKIKITSSVSTNGKTVYHYEVNPNNLNTCLYSFGYSGFGGTIISALENDTHKGIVYLNPANLNTVCNAANTELNVNNNGTPTGITSGCMKFYIYDDSGDKYKLILDHNTSGSVAWNSSGGNSSMNEVAARLTEDTSGWLGSPRLITADEIAHIVGVDTTLNWDSTDANSDSFYFDEDAISSPHIEIYGGSNSNESTANSSNKSRYAWLYDNTCNCGQNGCNIEDNNEYPYGTKNSANVECIYGYWTSSASASYSVYAWRVSSAGLLAGDSVEHDDVCGVRPVITLSKSILE